VNELYSVERQIFGLEIWHGVGRCRFFSDVVEREPWRASPFGREVEDAVIILRPSSPSTPYGILFDDGVLRYLRAERS